MKHFLLSYEVGPEYMERRAEFRAEHLAKAWASAERGELLLGGAVTDPTDLALIVFRADSPEVAEEFARTDPYVLNGLVRRWRVREWVTVVGSEAAKPLRP